MYSAKFTGRSGRGESDRKKLHAEDANGERRRAISDNLRISPEAVDCRERVTGCAQQIAGDWDF